MRTFRRRIPPLSSLVAFEAAARLQSFTRAAAELGITQAAVSRQVKELEEFLQAAMFDRGYRTIVLTEAGKSLFVGVTEHLSGIASVCDSIRQPNESNAVVVGMTSAFGTYWLTPRLPEFRSLHPNIELRLAVNDEIVDLAKERIDVSIRYGTGRWPNLRSQYLLGAEDMPVCSPSYLGSRGRLSSATDLLGEVLIFMEGAPAFLGSHWNDWFSANGVDATGYKFGLTVNNFSMMIQATLRGQGIALAGYPLIDDLLAQGDLVPALNAKPRRVSGGYFVVEPESRARSGSCAAFCSWLFQRAEQDANAVGLARLLSEY
jgi:DNA-binding transcriptional LysR family regulator